MDRINKNRLIAEFMGNSAEGWNYWYFRLTKNWEIEVPESLRAWLPFMSHKGYFSTTIFKPFEAKFHTSWDWLMPVVEKIEDLQDGEGGDAIRSHLYDFEVRRISCMVHGADIEVSDASSKIEAVYQAVVEFIIWYNQNK
jgi:hypothetical protein